MAELNRNELEALRVLWECGELKPAQIEAEFAWDVDNGTLRSILKVLMEKGLVSRRKAGNAFIYKAKQSRSSVLLGMAKSMAQVFAGGSPAALVSQLIKLERLSPKEIDELRRIAEANSSGAEPPRGRRK